MGHARGWTRLLGGALLGLLCLWPGRRAWTADEEPFESYTLKNGLHVILARDAHLPGATVLARYHVGARQESVGRTGLAHFLEHLTFDSDWPASFNGDNASTSFDYTQFHSTVRNGYIAPGIWAESWRMSDSVRMVGSRVFARERNIVKNERRQRLETQPYGFAEEKLFAALFPPPHPYSARVIGRAQDIDAVTLDEIRTFFDTWYQPNNCTVAVVGNFDLQEARQRIAEYFDTIPAKGIPVPPPLPVAPLDHAVVIRHVETIGRTTQVTMAWRSPSAYQPGDAAAAIAAEIIGSLRASRMRGRVPEAYGSSAQQNSYRAGSLFRIDTEPREGVNPDDLVISVDAMIEELATQGPTQAEVDAAARVILKERIKRYEDTLGRASFLIDVRTELESGKPLAFERARILAVKPEDVQAFARKYLGKDQRVVVISTPVANTAGGGGAR